MLTQLSTIIIHLIQQSSYFAVFLFMTLESMLVPIPSEVTMPFAGFLAEKGHVILWLIVLLGALGNLLGSLIAYAVGYFLEESVLIGLIKKYGKFILVTEHDYTHAMQWYQKYGSGVTFFSRLLPVVRTFISLPAGLSEMNLWKFSFYTFLGSLLWSGVLAWIGYLLGNNWQSIHPLFQKFQDIIIGIIILGIIWYINHKLKLIPFGKKKS